MPQTNHLDGSLCRHCHSFFSVSWLFIPGVLQSLKRQKDDVSKVLKIIVAANLLEKKAQGLGVSHVTSEPGLCSRKIESDCGP